MKLAIVIPYFKINFLDACLQSLKEQTVSDFNVYIGDDQSPDTPTKLIHKYEQHLQIVYKRFDTNFGSKSLVSQWNRCIDLIQEEEWIIILGDDDCLGKKVVEHFYDNLRGDYSNSIHVMRSNVQIIDDVGQVISKASYTQKLQLAKDLIMRKIRGDARGSLSELIFKKSKLKFTDYPLAWHSDDMAIVETSGFGYVQGINEFTYIRKSELNISSSKNLNNVKNKASFQYYTDLVSLYRNHFTEEELALLNRQISKTVVGHRKNVLLLLSYFKFVIKNSGWPHLPIFLKKYILK
jgi:glycosyltransferase involved in cell wall biosynthesis